MNVFTVLNISVRASSQYVEIFRDHNGIFINQT